MKSLRIIKYILVFFTIFITSYILIMDNNKIFVNDNINHLCTNHWGYFVIFMCIIAVVLFCISFMVTFLTETLMNSSGVLNDKN